MYITGLSHASLKSRIFEGGRRCFKNQWEQSKGPELNHPFVLLQLKGPSLHTTGTLADSCSSSFGDRILFWVLSPPYQHVFAIFPARSTSTRVLWKFVMGFMGLHILPESIHPQAFAGPESANDNKRDEMVDVTNVCFRQFRYVFNFLNYVTIIINDSMILLYL